MSTEQVRPTKKQRELLAFIEAFIAEHGYSPSYREIMTGLNYTSVATVALHVNSLIKRGHLLRRDGKARSLEVARPSINQDGPTSSADPGDEKWLIGKIDAFFIELEQAEAHVIERARLQELHTLIEALKVLGLDGAAQSFVSRLSSIKQRVVATSHEQRTPSVE
ncbi:MAG: LexA family protein [Candidatus Saccharibacteria bacterium]